jgi:hypothetical protein
MVQHERLGKGNEGCHIRWMTDRGKPSPEVPAATPPDARLEPEPPAKTPREIGGPKGPEPTRYGDWEIGGRCTDF